MHKVRFLTFFLVAINLPLWAQQFSLRQYTVVDGLPQSQVNMILEDPNGYLWIGTQGGGLARFDGREFKVYTTRDGLLSNIINYLKLDSKQNLWIVHPRGITRFDGTDFMKFQPPVPPYTGRRVRRVFEHKDTIFLVSNQGKLGKIYKDSVYYWDNRVLKDKIILYTHLLPNKDICLYLNDSSFLVRSKEDYTLSHKEKFSQALTIFNYKNEVWVNTNQGYFVIDFASRKIDKRQINVRNHIIQFDSLHNFFWTNSEKGLYREFDQNQVHVIDTVLKEVDVTQIFQDAEGNTWLGSSGNGLYKYFMQDFDRCASKRLTAVTAIEKSKDGTSWIGSLNRGIWKMKKGKIRSYNTNSQTDNAVFGIKATPSGMVWVASSSGLGVYDEVKDNFKWFTREDGISSGHVNCLELDDLNRIWYGTVGGGVGYYDNKVFKTFAPEDGLNGRNVVAIKFFPPTKTIYSGSEFGLNSIKDGVVSTVSLPEFTNTVIQSINIYKKSWLLLGSGGAGVMLYDPISRTRRIIDSQEGLPSDFINFVAADEEDQIWIGTEKGITRIRLDGELNVLENLSFGYDNGLAGVETNRNAFYFGKEKYFGLVDGIYQYNNLTNSGNSFDLHLTAVEIFYDQLSGRQFSNNVQGFFKIPNRPILPSDKNHITFRFNRVDKRYPKSIQFKYFLENYDKTWSQPSSIAQATYGNLPPGNYVFKALATNSQGSWANVPLQYAFVIKAPFYQTGAFQVGVAAVVIGLLSLYLYIRVRRNINKMLETQRIRQQEQDSLRKEIARDFHDEMGNQLTRIINYVSQMKIQANGHSSILYNKVEDSAKYLYSGTRDFIWSIDPVNDELSRLFLHIRDFGEKLFEEKSIKFRAFNELKEEVVRVPYGFGREANLIFKEAMANVFAHAKAQNVSFSLKQTNDQFEMKLEDDGVGFKQEEVAKLNGIRNMNSRAKRIHASLHLVSGASGGTVISLVFKIQKNKVYDNAR